MIKNDPIEPMVKRHTKKPESELFSGLTEKAALNLNEESRKAWRELNAIKSQVQREPPPDKDKPELPEPLANRLGKQIADMQSQIKNSMKQVEDMQTLMDYTTTKLDKTLYGLKRCRGYGGASVNVIADHNYEVNWTYVDEWSVSYICDATSGLMESLAIKKGYFNFGKFRAIAASDYTLDAPAVAGDYVIVAKLYASAMTLPTVAAYTEADYESAAHRYGYDGVSAWWPIARATVADSGGTMYWKSLKQCHYGEIWVDRYDPRTPFVSGTGACGQIESEGSGSVKVLSQIVVSHLRGVASVYQCAAEATFIISSPTIIYCRVNFDSNWNVDSATLIADTTASPLADDEAAWYKYIPLWYVNGDGAGSVWVEGHLHHGIVHIYGDAMVGATPP